MKGTIRQRSPGSWRLEVYLARDSSGKRLRHMETVRGRKSEAQRRLREILADLDQGIAPPMERYTLRDWLDAWMHDMIVPHRRQKTIERYSGIIRLHIAPFLGEHELGKITPLQVQTLSARLLREGKSAKSVQMAHHVLGAAMQHAVNMELIPRNPVSLTKAPVARRNEAPTPDIDTVQRLLDYAKETESYIWPCLHLIAYTGLRRGEALGLKREYVDLDNQTLRIVGSLVSTS